MLEIEHGHVATRYKWQNVIEAEKHMSSVASNIEPPLLLNMNRKS